MEEHNEFTQDALDSVSVNSTDSSTEENPFHNPYHLAWEGLPLTLPSSLSLTRPRTTLENYKYFYTAFKALVRGSRNPLRPALPAELAIYIGRLAEFGYINQEYTQESLAEDVEVGANGPEVATKMWFKTRPFTRYQLGRMKSIQLVTLSRHQGWVSDPNAGSWSWFDLRIARFEQLEEGSEPNSVAGDDERIWYSHEHPIDSRDYGEHTGTLFDHHHQIWDNITEGDSIEVLMNAQFGGWKNKARHGVIEFFTWFEPSIHMLNLIYGAADKD